MTELESYFRIKRLKLQNFRCFASCELNLHPNLTVLVAENAQGKTALLDALSIALQDYVAVVGRGKEPHGFVRDDIHLRRGIENTMEAHLPTRFEVNGKFLDDTITWARTLSKNSFHAKTSTKETKDIRWIANFLADRPGVNDEQKMDESTVLPVVAYYGTGRLYDEHRLTKGKRLLAKASLFRSSAYLDCLSSSSSYKSFSAWFGQKWEEVRDPRFRAAGFDDRSENHIAAVRNAVSIVLEPTGWTNMAWHRVKKEDDYGTTETSYISLEHPVKGQLPLTHMSDGVRNMVALVGDLAHRCVRLNPYLSENAAELTPGIVLIDEVDMHLHPRWQQLVVGMLQKAFPEIQFVLSTHSPHVLSTVNSESIRTITLDAEGNGRTASPPDQTQGDESGNVLARAMHVDPVPNVGPARQLSDYRALVQRGLDQSPQAISAWRNLVAHFGEDHHLLQEAAVLRNLQDFKREHGLPVGGEP